MLPKPTAEPSVAKKTAIPEENVSLFFEPVDKASTPSL
jgi:hypothetical protein